MNRRAGLSGVETLILFIVIAILAFGVTSGILKQRAAAETDRNFQHDYNRLQSVVDFNDGNVRIVVMPVHMLDSLFPELTQNEDGSCTTPDGWIIKYNPTETIQ